MVHPEVMVPLIITVEELESQKAIIDRMAQEVGFTGYLVGTIDRDSASCSGR